MSRPPRRFTYRPSSLEGRLLRGDPEAIGTVSRWIGAVLTDLRFWGLQQDWLDLHQDSMVGVLESLGRGRFDPAREFRFYVHAIARYTLRRASFERRRSPRGDPELAAELRNPDDSYATASRTVLLAQVLSRIPDDCRRLMLEYFCDQRSYQELATSHNIPIGTVKSRLSRCLAAARRLLDAVAEIDPPVRTSGRAALRRGRSNRSAGTGITGDA